MQPRARSGSPPLAARESTRGELICLEVWPRHVRDMPNGPRQEPPPELHGAARTYRTQVTAPAPLACAGPSCRFHGAQMTTTRGTNGRLPTLLATVCYLVRAARRYGDGRTSIHRHRFVRPSSLTPHEHYTSSDIHAAYRPMNCLTTTSCPVWSICDGWLLQPSYLVAYLA